MQIQEVIAEMMSQQAMGLCSSCHHNEICIFHKIDGREILACELFVLNIKHPIVHRSSGGLCRTCENAETCELPVKDGGVWHCNDFL
jgi:hypothetical protein